MPYTGDKLSDFVRRAKPATRRLMHDLADLGGDMMVEHTVRNTPIGGRPIGAIEGGAGGGNLRSSWYQKPVERVRDPRGPAYESGVATNVDYAPHVEYGTGLWGPNASHYPIRPKTPGGALRFRSRTTGDIVYAAEVMHPGSPGAHMVSTAAALTEHEFDTRAAGLLRRWATEVESG